MQLTLPGRDSQPLPTPESRVSAGRSGIGTTVVEEAAFPDVHSVHRRTPSNSASPAETAGVAVLSHPNAGQHPNHSASSHYRSFPPKLSSCQHMGHCRAEEHSGQNGRAGPPVLEAWWLHISAQPGLRSRLLPSSELPGREVAVVSATIFG